MRLTVSSTQRVHMNFNSHTERLTYEVVTHFRNANYQQMWTDLHWFMQTVCCTENYRLKEN